MKIFACCNWGLKFAGLVVDAWRAAGHEVEFAMGYDPKLHDWAELCFVDVCDANAQHASQERRKARLVVRAIDIECWVGQPGGVTWQNVDGLVFGARHIEELVRSYVQFPPGLQVEHVPFGIDLSKWTFREHDGSRREIACVAHRWTAKGLPVLYQLVASLGPGWRLHLLGTRSNERWLHVYLDHLAAELGIVVTQTDSVPDVDAWLEDKDYHVCAGQKEAFSYATAEAAAKGLKPLVHNFWRAGDIWPEGWIWTSLDEARDKMLSPFNSAGYRKYVQGYYSVERMMSGLNRICMGLAPEEV